MPIKRFADVLHREGKLEEYMQLLVDSFNPATAHDLMCRELLSVGYDGALYDCDFNYALEMPHGLGPSQSHEPRARTAPQCALGASGAPRARR